MIEFIGQEKIWTEVSLVVEDIKNNGNNHSIIFRAPSGYGKTTLALMCINFIGLNKSMYYFPSDDGLGMTPPLNLNKKISILDEAHRYKNQERLYPLMDSGEYSWFILTNETGSLKEPLVNRCIQFIFQPYTKENLSKIAENSLATYKFPQEFLSEIGKRCIHPREVKITCERLRIVFNNYLIPKTLEEFNSILEEILGINDNGFTVMEENYLNFLGKVGGVASLNTIANGLRVDKATILRDIEPKLLYTNKILISSKGRKLNEN